MAKIYDFETGKESNSIVEAYIDRFEDPSDAGTSFLDSCAAYWAGFLTVLIPWVIVIAKKIG